MFKTGVANLPLHYGKTPAWLFIQMKELAREITYWIVKEFSPDEMLTRLSDPFWFQAFGCVLGFDWHSSGLTTTVCGALKEAMRGREKDLGLFVVGGKGMASRKTPKEIIAFKERVNIETQIEDLVYASRLSAKVDNTALQDGYQLYHHLFIFTKNGNWAVIQQGMNTYNRWARRYHWLGKDISSFVCEPHKAICCDHKNKTLNMIAKESQSAREISTYLAKQKPKFLLKEIYRLKTLSLPKQHQVFLSNLDPKHLNKVLLRTYEYKPENFEQLLGINGVGPKTIRSLALISELIYGKPASKKDPVKFSFAHGGKDGYPYKIDRIHYQRSIDILHRSLSEAKIGRNQKLKAIKRLAKFYN
jgi:hypothetical protein